MSIIFYLLIHIGFAENMDVHTIENKEITVRLVTYEKRLQELIVQKDAKKDEAELDEILSEIADIQKDLVHLRKQRRQLREHVTKKHPNEELMEDLNILKDSESKAAKKGDPALDARLDALLLKLRQQYGRTARYRDNDFSDEKKKLDLELQKKRKTIDKEHKDAYIKESIKTQLKVE